MQAVGIPSSILEIILIHEDKHFLHWNCMDSISHHHQKILLTSKFLKKGLQTRIYVSYLFVDRILKTFFTKMIILYYHSAGSILMTFVYQLGIKEK